MHANTRLVEKVQPVVCFSPAVPNNATPLRVSLKNYLRCTFLVHILNGAAPVPGAVTLHQSRTVAGAGEKALGFAVAHRALDTAAGDALAEFAVTANTFTPDNTAAKGLLYVIDVRPEDLDVAGGFDCVRVGLANATQATTAVVALLGPAKYGGAPLPSAIVD
jgi:hypothetical protein